MKPNEMAWFASFKKINHVIIFLIFLCLFSSKVWAGIESVYPSLADLGQDLNVIVRGSQFSVDTRISISPDSSNSAKEIGYVPLSGSNKYDMAVVENIVFVAIEDSLEIIDISDPSSPSFIKSLSTPLGAELITIEGDRAHVAGGGPDASGDIWEETKAYANYAYDSLIYQGYKHEDITYLTDEQNALSRYGALTEYANLKTATREHLKNAITVWAKKDSDTSGLILYLVDHGSSKEFQIRGSADTQNVTVAELDSWLKTLQKTMKGKVVFVHDACKSGSFLSMISPAGSGSRLRLPVQTIHKMIAFPILTNSNGRGSCRESSFLFFKHNGKIQT